MPVILGKNINAEKIVRQLGDATQRIGTVFERLSSGLRINSASDDAAGLAVATDLQVRARIANQGIRNVNDGISFLSIAEGAVSSLVEIITRQKELAEQAANGSYSLKQRQALDKEARALTDEYNRIVASTSFNGINVLGATDVVVQSGVGSVEATQIGIGNELSQATAGGGGAIGAGTFSVGGTIGSGLATRQILSADFDGDGDNDIALATNNLIIGFNNGTGTAFPGVYLSTSEYRSALALGDVDGNGTVDIVSIGDAAPLEVVLGNGDGTFGAAISGFNPGGSYGTGKVALADFNGDSRLDVVISGSGGTFVNVAFGNGNGTFAAVQTLSTGVNTQGLTIADINGDGRPDIIAAGGLSSTIAAITNAGGGSFNAVQTVFTGNQPYFVAAADFNSDGKIDIVGSSALGNGTRISFGNGDGTFALGVNVLSNSADSLSVADINQDGFQDVFTGGNVVYGNGNGTFRAPVVVSPNINSNGATIADLNRDGVPDLIFNDYSTITFFLQDVLSSSSSSGAAASLSHIDLTTVATARSALDSRSQVLDGLTSTLGTIGAYQSRLQSVVRRLQSTSLEYEAARHRIIDADVASETATLVAQSVRREVASSLLAQANLQGDIVLKLIKG